MFRAALARRRAEARARRELEALSDRELAELGLMRCDVGRVAREAARG